MSSYTGVTFGTKHSWTDYGLRPVKFEHPLPAQRKEQQEVPGMNGVLDLSRALTGYIIYENRELVYTFTLRAHSQEEFNEKIFPVRNELDGMELNITEDDDSQYYYTGTPAVEGDYDPEEIDQEVTVTVDAEPFKKKLQKTSVQETITESGTITCQNARMETIPTITASADCSVEFEGTSYSVQQGERIIPDIILKPGSNVFSVTGSVTLKFEYQEGAF